MSVFLKSLIIAAFIMLSPSPAHAQEKIAPAGTETAPPAAAPLRIGTVAATEGVVGIMHDNTPAVANVGQDVFFGDIIETGPEAKTLLVFSDDTELTLGENARLTVDDYVFDPADTAGNKARYNVVRGAFIMVSGLIGKRENPDVIIETSYGSIGIRGTIVWGGLLDDEYNVFVQEGAVRFSTGRGQVVIRAGEGSKVPSLNAIPERAKIWGEPKIARAVQTIALKDPDSAKASVAGIRARNNNKHEEPKPQPQPEPKQEQTPDKKAEEKKAEKKAEQLQPTGDTAPDLEQGEKNHLQNQSAEPVPPGFK